VRTLCYDVVTEKARITGPSCSASLPYTGRSSVGLSSKSTSGKLVPYHNARHSQRPVNRRSWSGSIDWTHTLFLSNFSANELSRIIVILNDIDVTALPRITLNNRKLAAPEFFDFLGLAIEIVIVDLADQIPMRVHLDKIGLSVKIPTAFNLDHLIVFVGFDDIRPTISVCATAQSANNNRDDGTHELKHARDTTAAPPKL
jgi:hypothetical protein